MTDSNNNANNIMKLLPLPPCRTKCILCLMPRCERCYVCRRSSEGGGDEGNNDNSRMVAVDDGGDHDGRGCCLRKMCCKLPLELKLQQIHPTSFSSEEEEEGVGTLPKEQGWYYYTFDDPQLTSLVYSTTRSTSTSTWGSSSNNNGMLLSLSGLKIITHGDGKEKKKLVFHSLVGAFDSLVAALLQQHKTSTSSNDDDDDVMIINQATNILINFASHIGTSPIINNTTHFLIDKPYCIEFTTPDKNGGGRNAVLFGMIVACLKQQSCTTNNNNNNINNNDDEMFIVKYDKDALRIITSQQQCINNNNSSGTLQLSKFQLLSTSQAYGGCILYERTSQMKKDVRYSTIQNVDQATPVETWITPDLRYEGMITTDDGVDVDHVDEQRQQMQQQKQEEEDRKKLLLPQLTIFARGYKFIFTVKKISTTNDDYNNKNARQQQQQHEHEDELSNYGVFVTCTSTNTHANREINIKPGELIDLGTFAPLPHPSSSSGGGDDNNNNNDDEHQQTKKTLAAFIIKNYIHSYTPGEYGVTIATNDNYVYDITSDITGTLTNVARQHVLSYVRCCNNNNNKKKTGGGMMVYPTIHTRCDPFGRVHLLFGIPYLGNWTEYEYGMSTLVPLLMGGNEMEVMTTSSRGGGGGGVFSSSSRKKRNYLGKTKKEEVDDKYLSSIGMFQTDDILSCNDQLERMIHTSKNSGGSIHERSFIERSKHVVKCLEGRAKELYDMFTDAKQRSLTQKDNDDDDGNGVRMIAICEEQSAILNSAIEQLHKLSIELDGHHHHQHQHHHQQQQQQQRVLDI